MVEEVKNGKAGAESNASVGDIHDEIDLLELWYRLVENIKYIIAAAIGGALIAALISYTLLTPQYEATAQLYVLSPGDSVVNLSDLQIGSYLTKDYQQVLRTWEITEKVIAELQLDYDYDTLQKMLRISNPGDTRILQVTISSNSPREAMTIANAYASVAQDYIAVTMATERPSIVSAAREPASPVSPNKRMNTLMGLVVGALLATGIVVLRFIMDDKLKTAEDIRRYTDMPTLAVIPTINTAVRARTASAGQRRRA